MKIKYLTITLILIIYSTGVCAQKYTKDSCLIIDISNVTIGMDNIKQVSLKDTLKIYYFHKDLFFMNKMNETTGKKSARYEDSANRYYKLLCPKK